MTDFKAKMHQMPRWGSLQRSPKPPSWIWGPISKEREREGRGGRGGEERGWEGRRGQGRRVGEERGGKGKRGKGRGIKGP